MKKLGLSIQALVSRYGVDRALELVRESGFDAVDFGLELWGTRDGDLYSASEDEFCSYFDSVKRKADSLGLEISQTHGRCVAYIAGNDDYNARALRVSELDLKATKLLGAPACVIHPLNRYRCPDFTPEEMRSKSLELFTYLCALAGEQGVKVSLETFGGSSRGMLDFFGDVHELSRLMDEINSPNLTLCIDTGHCNGATRYGEMPPEEAIRFFGGKFTLLHLNENNGYTDQHQPPYFGGTVQWSSVLDALDAVCYGGVYNFELELRSHGAMLERYVNFLGEYLRAFVERQI